MLDNDGRTALIFASKYGHIEVAKLLIEEVADVNAQGNYGQTAFYHKLGYKTLSRTFTKKL